MKHSVRNVLKALILSVSVFCAALSFHYKKNTNVSKIKVFFEAYASSPVLWESVEFIKSLPKENELKVFFWHRYPNRSELFDLKKINGIEIQLNHAEGWPIYSSPAFIKRLKEIASQYPGAKFEIYSNINQTRYFLIPLIWEMKDKIEHVHLYEDGACNVYGSEYGFWSQFHFDPAILEKRKNAKTFIPVDDQTLAFWKASVGKLVPATYHLCMGDKIKNDPALKNYVAWIGKDHIQNADLKSYASRLTPKEKKQLERFFKITPLKKKHLGEKILFLTTGYVFGSQKGIQNQINMFAPFRHSAYRVIIKCHPSQSAKEECRQIHKAFPEWEMIDPSTPLEAFFLTGNAPDKIAGFSSSLYFLVPPEKILFLKGHYSNRLLDIGVIDKRKLHLPAEILALKQRAAP